MQIIIPMAGSGTRFKNAGYKDPKPIINIAGKPMIQYVIDLFPGEHDFLFICRDEHLEQSDLRAVLSKLAPQGQIVSVTSKDLGPVHNILKVQPLIKDDEPVVVNYCDFDMDWDYADFKKIMAEKNAQSACVCYRGFHPHLLGPNLYAGTRVDENLNVLEVKEKYSFTPNKMDTWQQTGTFYFASGELLKKYCEELVDKNITCNGEYYVSLLYNLMIRDGVRVALYPVKHFCQWGTPEDLEEYLAWADFVNKNPKEKVDSYPGEVLAAAQSSSPEDLRKTHHYWQEHFSQTV